MKTITPHSKSWPIHGDLMEQTTAGARHGLSWGLTLSRASSRLPSLYTCEVHSIISILKMRKMKVREVKGILQGHTTHTQQNQNGNPSLSIPGPPAFMFKAEVPTGQALLGPEIEKLVLCPFFRVSILLSTTPEDPTEAALGLGARVAWRWAP